MGPPSPVLRVVEVPGYAEAHPNEPTEKAVLVDVNGRHFGLLYRTASSHTLAWEGIVGFDRLEAEMAHVLGLVVQKNVSLQDSYWRNRISVALIVRRPDGDDELLKCRLAENGDRALYTDAIADLGRLEFARYDVHDSAAPPEQMEPFFSLIAENAALQQGFSSEVALKLPRSHRWSEGLLDWVVKRHRYTNLWAGTLESSLLADRLNNG